MCSPILRTDGRDEEDIGSIQDSSSGQKDSSSGGQLMSVASTDSFSQSNESIKQVTIQAMSHMYAKDMMDHDANDEIKKIEIQEKIANKVESYWEEHNPRTYNECLDALKIIYSEATSESFPDSAKREISQSSTEANKDTRHSVYDTLDMFKRTTELKREAAQSNLERDPEEAQEMHGQNYPVIRATLDRIDQAQAEAIERMNDVAEREARQLYQEEQRGRAFSREDAESEPATRPRSRSSLLDWLARRQQETTRPHSTDDTPTRYVANLEQESPPSYIDDID